MHWISGQVRNNSVVNAFTIYNLTMLFRYKRVNANVRKFVELHGEKQYRQVVFQAKEAPLLSGDYM